MIRWLRRLWLRGKKALIWVWQQEGTPGQRARGLGAGIFCGCFPFFGLQTLLGIALASVMRGNHLLAAAGTWISNPFTYVPLYWFNYQVGDMLLRGGPAPTAEGLNQATLWSQGWAFTLRLLLGSSVVGGIAALVIGVVAWRLFRWQTTQRRRINAGSQR